MSWIAITAPVAMSFEAGLEQALSVKDRRPAPSALLLGAIVELADAMVAP